MKAQTFWSSLSERFRNRFANVMDRNAEDDDGNGDSLPGVGKDGVLQDAVQHPDDAEEVSSEEKGGALSRWSRRDQTIKQMQEGYERVNGLIENIQKHLASQEERGGRVCESLEKLAASVHQFPEAARQQADTLEAIGSQIETANARASQMGEIVQELPKLARVQSDALASIARQLEIAQEQGGIANQTMERLGNAIQTLNESNSAQVKALWTMSSATGEQNELLTTLIAKQSKLFIILITIVAIMTAAVVTVSVVGLQHMSSM